MWRNNSSHRTLLWCSENELWLNSMTELTPHKPPRLENRHQNTNNKQYYNKMRTVPSGAKKYFLTYARNQNIYVLMFVIILYVHL